MLILKRKNIVLVMLVLLLVVTGYLNFLYNQNVLKDGTDENLLGNSDKKAAVTVKDAMNDGDDKEEGEDFSSEAVKATSSAGFFVEYRFERENARKEEIEYIREIVDNPKSEV